MKKNIVGKEYYLSTCENSAIIRKNEKGVEYLELQSEYENGFKPLNDKVLDWRFGAKKSRTAHGVKLPNTTTIVEVDAFKNVKGLKELFGYINTNENKQMKGKKGTLK